MSSYPLYEVVPFTWTYNSNVSTGYLLLAQANASSTFQAPANFANMAQTLALKAVANYAAYPHAYVTGNGSNNTWNGDAAAKAAAQADFATLVAARDLAVATAALSTALPNPYTSIGNPVSGPV
jgi:hypothetical protein